MHASKRAVTYSNFENHALPRENDAMTADELRSLQAPLKAQYRERPETASVTLRAEGRIGENMTCKIETGKSRVEAGLHPATGGDGQSACSADMLLEALVGCAGVTLRAVATALGISLRDAKFALKAISIFAARWAFPKMCPSVLSRFD